MLSWFFCGPSSQASHSCTSVKRRRWVSRQHHCPDCWYQSLSIPKNWEQYKNSSTSLQQKSGHHWGSSISPCPGGWLLSSLYGSLSLHHRDIRYRNKSCKKSQTLWCFECISPARIVLPINESILETATGSDKPQPPFSPPLNRWLSTTKCLWKILSTYIPTKIQDH